MEFKQGDKVWAGDVPATVKSGPYPCNDRPFVVIELEDGDCSVFSVYALTKRDDDPRYLTVVHVLASMGWDVACEEQIRAAREIVAALEAMEQPLKVGDRVRVVRDYQDCDSRFDGREGTLLELVPEDSEYPYKVSVPGDRARWVHEVERVGD